MFLKKVLDNGIRLITYKMPEMKSVSVGLWVNTGSRCETPENNGVSHFIEHMLFKGTKNRDAKKISEIFDSIGGQINAFTGKECTCFYTKTLSSYLDISLDVLSDMFFNSLFAENEMELEKNVVIEEINMYEDAPEELVHDISALNWKGSLGYTILGPKDNIINFTQKDIQKYMQENYTLNRLVISVAGNFNDDELNNCINKYFGNREKTISEIKYKENIFNEGNIFKEKETEQTHLCIAYPGLDSRNDLVYPMLALNSILGGGMSSRLFQEIREKNGYAYSVYSYTSSYMKEGTMEIYAGFNPNNYDKVMELINKEIEKIVTNGVTKKEIENAKTQLKGNFLLGLENTTSLMSYGGKSEVLWNYIESIDEVLEQIQGVNEEKINEVIKKSFATNKKSVTIVGNGEKKEY